jgi:hypothetical protein
MKINLNTQTFAFRFRSSCQESTYYPLDNNLCEINYNGSYKIKCNRNDIRNMLMERRIIITKIINDTPSPKKPNPIFTDEYLRHENDEIIREFYKIFNKK